MASLTPEFSVTDYARSLAFYTQVLGFGLRYARADEGFAMLELDGVSLMIDRLHTGRDFDATLTAADRPFGRGVNLEITVDDLAPILARIDDAGLSLHLPLEEKWYRRQHDQIGRRQFIVADPDGYLLRFAEDLGTRLLDENTSCPINGTKKTA